MPFFSIIIPTYNADLTLKNSLESIKAQTFVDFEVLIMDGLSTDKTGSIAESFHKEDNRFLFYPDKDSGVYDAMNKGVQKASGKWIYVLGSDDSFYDTMVLEDVYRETVNSNVDAIYGNIYSDRFGGLYDNEFTLDKLYEKNIAHQSIFLKRTVFEKIGPFNLIYKLHADWDHNVRWFLDNKIGKKFIRRTIANYADNGLSSRQGDPIFQLDKASLFYKRAGKRIDKKLLPNILMGIAIKMKEEHNYPSFIYFKLRSWISRYA